MVCIMVVNSSVITTKAAAVENLGNITVRGVEPGTTATIYPIVKERFDISVLQPINPRYIWIESIRDWVAANYPQYIDLNNAYAVTEDFSEATDAEIAEFYDKLSAVIKRGELEVENASVVAETDTVVFDPLITGNYMILVENGVRVYRPLTASVTREWNGTAWEIVCPVVDAKSSVPTISKTVTDALEKDHFLMGDSIAYTLDVVIPDYPENAIAKQLVVSDKLSESLTLSEDSIKVYGVNAGSDPVLLNNSYTKTAERPDNTEGERSMTFSLYFDYAKIAEYTSLKITYDAVLNEKAMIGEEGNQNHAYMDYNNNPYAEGSWKSEDDTVTVYTYGLAIAKVDEDTSEPLKGASFSIYKDEQIIRFVNEDGIYRVAKEKETAVTELPVDDEGMLYIHGLDAGVYKVEEWEAPDGYVKLQHPVEITITDEDLDGKVEADGQELEDGMMTLTVKNGKGFTLPVTGGMGTALFSMSGVLMMSAGLLVMMAVLKKHGTK